MLCGARELFTVVRSLRHCSVFACVLFVVRIEAVAVSCT